MVGSAIYRHLKKNKNNNLIIKSKSELDLCEQTQVDNFLSSSKIDQIYIAAAKVGGIFINSTKPAEFIYKNLMIETNLIHSAYKNNIKKILFLGSSCIYPKNCKQPMKEEYLLSGKLETTNQAYSISKIAGINLCKFYTEQYGKSKNIDYRNVMPTNLYGENDTYSLNDSHVIPALLLKFHLGKINNTKSINVWGSGLAKREFLEVNDLAKACCKVMNLPKKTYYGLIGGNDFLNIGTGQDITIKKLAYIIKDVTGYDGKIIFDKSKPDGMKRKLLDVRRIKKIGWKPLVKINKGIQNVYTDFLLNYKINLKQTNAIKKIKIKDHNDKHLNHPLVRSSWGKNERDSLQKVISSNQFTMGKQVKRFEQQFSKFVNSKYAVMVNSGSSANLLMVASLFYKKKNFLKRGDEVIVPSVSWSTSYFPLYQYGLKLIFVDIDKETLTFDINQLKKAITKKTRLILAVNLLGNANNFSEINKIIKKKNIYLIEDSCQAMGTKYKGKYTGTFGIAGSFSTFYSHHINTMEGGLIVTKDLEIYQILLSLRAHGWVRELPKINKIMNKTGNFFKDSFSFALPGYNVRPLEISASLGIEQLKKINSILKARRRNAFALKKILRNHPDLMCQKEIGISSWFGFALIIKRKSKLTKKSLLSQLNNLGFETRPISAGNFARNKVIKLFNYKIQGNLPNAEYIDKFGIYIGNNHLDIKEVLTRMTKVRYRKMRWKARPQKVIVLYSKCLALCCCRS